MRLLQFLTFAFLFATISCSNSNSEGMSQSASTTQAVKNTSISLLNPTDFEAKMAALEKQATVVDVRTPNEFRTGYIAKATNVDFYAKDFLTKMEALPKDKAVMVYCAKGGRSGKASQKIKSLGFTQIYDLDGGMTQWIAEGKAVEGAE